MDVDPAASMKCWAMDIELGGRVFEIPALPAVDWWPVLAGPDPALVLEFITSPELDEAILSGATIGDDWSEALTDAIETVAGRSLHVAFVLAHVATHLWHVVGGPLARSGFRWDVMPIGAALDAVHSILRESMTEEGGKKFQALLDNESLTTGKPSERQRAKITSEFETMAGPKPTSGVRSTGGPSGSARPRTRTRRPPRPPGGPSAGPTPPPAPPA